MLLGVRDTERGEQVRRSLVERDHLRPDQVAVSRLDLLDLASMHRFAAEAARRPLDVLVLNAGISSVPLHLSPQGVESQFATNHLAHFALTGCLLTALERGTDPRSSRMARVRLGELEPVDASRRAVAAEPRCRTRSLHQGPSVISVLRARETHGMMA